MKRNFARVIAALLSFALVLTAAACGAAPPTAEELEEKLGVSFDNIICQYTEGPIRAETLDTNFGTNVTIYADGKVKIWTNYRDMVLAERSSTLSEEKRNALISAIRENNLLALDDCSNYDIMDGGWSEFAFYDAEGNKVHDCGGANCTNAAYCAVEELILSYITFGGIEQDSRRILKDYLIANGYEGYFKDDIYNGKLNISSFNEEFKDFFDLYYQREEGMTVEWVINPEYDGIYHRKLEENLTGEKDPDYMIDMFVVRKEYLSRYIESDLTMTMEEVGYTVPETFYQYALDAGTNSKGELKAVPIYLCPGALIYRRSIAREVLGTDDPAEVQARLDTWEKFEEVAAEASAKGYYMTASFAETLRPFVGSPDAFGSLTGSDPELDTGLGEWIAHAQSFLKNGYTLKHSFWSEEKRDAQVAKDGKVMCFFEPEWYYHFYMDLTCDETNSSYGDWAICQGPQAYEWGSTWLLVSSRTDNKYMIKDILDTFTKDIDVGRYIMLDKYLMPNNTEAVLSVANDSDYGFDMLGGQNEYAVLHEVAQQMQWNGVNEYREYTSEKIPDYLLPALQGKVPLESAVGGYNEALSIYFTEYLGIDPFGSPE